MMMLAACGGTAEETPTAVPPEPIEAPDAESAVEAAAEPSATPEPAEVVETAGTDIAGSSVVPCAYDLPEGEVEGETIVCGQIEVPLEWDSPDGSMLTISYAILRALGADPAADPILYFEGGPGLSALGNVPAYANAFEHIRQNRDIIIWDQRGNLFSSNLTCPDEVRDPRLVLSAEDLVATVEAAGPPPTLDPALLEPSTLDDDPLDILAKMRALRSPAGSVDTDANCSAYYAQQGIPIEAYSTANSARDAVALMEALDYPTYNLYPVSYGTTVGLETMRLYEQPDGQALPAIRSVLIDGVAPLYVHVVEEALLQPYNVLRVFDTCEADPSCAEAYPDSRQRLLELLTAVEQSPLPMNDGSELSEADLVSLLREVANGDKAGWAYLPRLIDELEHGETTLYNRLVERRSAPQYGLASEADVSNNDLREIIICNDRAGDLDIVAGQDLLRSFAAPQLVTEADREVELLLQCESWELANDNTPLPEPVTADLRTLVSNGAMDSLTAPEWGEVTFNGLPNAIMITFPISPHPATARSDCAREVMKAFFDDPDGELDLTCVDEMQPPFALPDDDLPPAPEDASE
jgi:pimeloyl-ACP methyl ester carboxylesterase